MTEHDAEREARDVEHDVAHDVAHDVELRVQDRLHTCAECDGTVWAMGLRGQPLRPWYQCDVCSATYDRHGADDYRRGPQATPEQPSWLFSIWARLRAKLQRAFTK